jgi:hypothetical protein
MRSLAVLLAVPSTCLDSPGRRIREVTAGSSAEVEAESTDTVRVTWEASGGDETATLGKWTGPDA